MNPIIFLLICHKSQLSFYIKFDLDIIPDIKNVKNLSESQQKQFNNALSLANKLTNQKERNQIIDKIKETAKSAIKEGDTANIQKLLSEMINSMVQTNTEEPIVYMVFLLNEYINTFIIYIVMRLQNCIHFSVTYVILL